jgi:adenylosuccinate lyase
VARGLVVYPKVIEASVMAELPFMATEEILMAAVQAGGDRQELHERIRQHSLAAAEQVKIHGKTNDLLQRLQEDSAFSTLELNWQQLLDPKQFIGRAAQQAAAFVQNNIQPIRSRFLGYLDQRVELRV